MGKKFMIYINFELLFSICSINYQRFSGAMGLIV